MKKLLFILISTILISCGGKKKEVDPELYQKGIEIAKERTKKYYEEKAKEFINGTQLETVHTSIEDSILIVKIIAHDDTDYDSFVEFYHDLAHKHSVRITGTQLQDSITGEILARCGYGFDCLED